MSELVSVTIPTKDSGASLERCLLSITSQDVPLEIVVADDCSTDDTREIARRFGARVLDGPLPLLEARCRAFAASKGDPVFMIDSDQFLETDALGRAIRELESVDAVVLEEFSSDRGSWLGSLFEADRRVLHANLDRHLHRVSGAILARGFRRSVLERALATIPDEVRRIAVAQDHAIIHEAVASITTSVGVVRDAVRHREMADLRHMWRKYFRWGNGLVELYERSPHYRSLTISALVTRVHRGESSFGDYVRSLLLMGLKVIPYSAGYAAGKVRRRSTRAVDGSAG